MEGRGLYAVEGDRGRGRWDGMECERGVEGGCLEQVSERWIGEMRYGVSDDVVD